MVEENVGTFIRCKCQRLGTNFNYALNIGHFVRPTRRDAVELLPPGASEQRLL